MDNWGFACVCGGPVTELTLLKRDLFGCVYVERRGGDLPPHVYRDTNEARWWIRPVARWLASREASALSSAQGMATVPQLVAWSNGRLTRTWIEGQPMQVARPRDPAYFVDALRVLRSLHRRGIAHNDLAKEPNWLVTEDGNAGIIDFQLARTDPSRGRLFRMQAREDLRHLLKHKRYYCSDSLTSAQRRILDRPSLPARLWRWVVKPVYLGITRGILRWEDREGASDRQFLPKGDTDDKRT